MKLVLRQPSVQRNQAPMPPPGYSKRATITCVKSHIPISTFHVKPGPEISTSHRHNASMMDSTVNYETKKVPPLWAGLLKDESPLTRFVLLIGITPKRLTSRLCKGWTLKAPALCRYSSINVGWSAVKGIFPIAECRRTNLELNPTRKRCCKSERMKSSLCLSRWLSDSTAWVNALSETGPTTEEKEEELVATSLE